MRRITALDGTRLIYVCVAGILVPYYMPAPIKSKNSIRREYRGKLLWWPRCAKNERFKLHRLCKCAGADRPSFGVIEGEIWRTAGQWARHIVKKRSCSRGSRELGQLTGPMEAAFETSPVASAARESKRTGGERDREIEYGICPVAKCLFLSRGVAAAPGESRARRRARNVRTRKHTAAHTYIHAARTHRWVQPRRESANANWD